MTQLTDTLQQARPFILFENTLLSNTDEAAWLFTQPVREIIALNSDELPAALAAIDEEREKGHYLAGYLSYEAGYSLSAKLTPFRQQHTIDNPLLQFYAFEAVTRLPPSEVTEALQQLPESEPYIRNWQPTESEAQYIAKLERIHEYIGAGDTYQVNHTYRVDFDLDGSIDGLYQALRERQKVAFSCLMHLPQRSVLSLSPELFIRKQGTRLSTKPMKGTTPRGKDDVEDAAILKAMAEDKKQRSENVMIVDLMRNDIGRLASAGSVKVSQLFEIQTFKTLHQMISTIEGQVEQKIPFAEVIKGLFPCGSITGTPKIRTMEIIHEMEATPRDIYTGAIGFITPDNDFTFNVPIRTLHFPAGSQHGTLGIGGGIIYESNPLDEWHESQLKARFVTGMNQQFKLIETLRYDASVQQLLRVEQHIARLTQSAAEFAYPLPAESVESLLNDYIRRFGAEQDLKVRLLLDAQGTLSISHEVLPQASDMAGVGASNHTADLPLVTLSNKRIEAGNLFRQHKTTNRKLYNQAFDEAAALGYYDVLFLNEHGHIAEASRHNLIIQHTGKWYTPPLSDGALPGVMRATLLADSQLNLQQRSLTLDDLKHAERIYLSNSVRGLVEVSVKEPDSP